MNAVLDHLVALNRKERFFLVAEALGNPGFRLGTDFQGRLADAIGVPFESEAVVFMDYHLDWLYAALVLGTSENPDQIVAAPGGADGPNVNANQEDVDLLVGFEHEGQVHLVMVEAKFESPWTSKQFRSKTTRLTGMFGSDGAAFPGVVPHLVLASPKDTTGNRLPLDGIPEWVAPGGAIPWVPIGATEAGRARITRCDESGQAARDGRFWRLVAATRSPDQRDAAAWQALFDRWFPHGVAYWRKDDADHPIWHVGRAEIDTSGGEPLIRLSGLDETRYPQYPQSPQLPLPRHDAVRDGAYFRLDIDSVRVLLDARLAGYDAPSA